MAERFEDLIVWQKARELTQLIYELTCGAGFTRDVGLRDQLRRATVSVMSNIAEGFERGGAAEFGRFVTMAKGSSGEIRCQLYVARDQRYLDSQGFEQAAGKAAEVSRMLYALKAKLKETRSKVDKVER